MLCTWPRLAALVPPILILIILVRTETALQRQTPARIIHSYRVPQPAPPLPLVSPPPPSPTSTASTAGCSDGRWCLGNCCSTDADFCSNATHAAAFCGRRPRPAARDPQHASIHRPHVEALLTDLPISELGNRTPAGYCAPAKSRGLCDSQPAGYWDLDELRAPSLAACAERCRACRRCSFVSFVPHLKLCSWHAECALSDLRPTQASAAAFSVFVKSAEPSAAAG
eukprot:7379079-Prymnesium_polylepis.1